MDNKNQKEGWLPTSADEMKKLGWEQADIILISGDAYIDHPSFGTAIIARVLEDNGYKVAILAQPNWRDDLRDFKKLGQPRLFFGISSGNMDSMVNHYTARKRLRSDDAYTAGNKSGFRPDYASVVYSNIVKKIFPNTPIVLGGIEASLRRLTHYDYWSDKLKPSLLAETNADILIYGMGEKAILEVAKQIEKNNDIAKSNIPQTAVFTSEKPGSYILLPSYIECSNNKKNFAKHFVIFEENSNKLNAKGLAEPYLNKYILVRPPYAPYTTEELDYIYSLPFKRTPHPRYNKKPPIPAYEMIKHSITSHRGCFGGCSFCTISAHQGKFIQSRSKKSIIDELEKTSKMSDFKGTISDIGGPSANMYGMQPNDINRCNLCKRNSCLYPTICNNINPSHKRIYDLFCQIDKNKNIKNAFVNSGIRYDLFLNDNGFLPFGKEYFEKLVSKHISGRLKVAPEHTSIRVLNLMRKPKFDLFLKLKKEYEKINFKEGKTRQIVPYLISSHPGSNMDDTFEMAIQLFKNGIYPEQMQDFTPTPMTLSSAMFYCEFNPYTLERINITKSIEEKKINNYVLLFHKKEFSNEISKAAKYLKDKSLFKKLNFLRT